MSVYRYEGPDERYPLAVPLLDVLLLMVVFYVIVSSTRIAPGELKLSVTDDNKTVARDVIRLDSTGQLYFNDHWYEPPELADVLKKQGLIDSGRTVHLLVEKETNFSTIKDILTVLKTSGLKPKLNVVLGGEN